MAQAIIFTSFGVANHEVRSKTLDKTAIEIAAKFPGTTVFQALTSNTIRERLLAEGFQAYSLPELLDSIVGDSFSKVLVQPSHLTAGEEYDFKIKPVVESYKDKFADLVLGEPLLYKDGSDGGRNDYELLTKALLTELAPKPGEMLLLVGHGSPHRHNPVYEKLQAYFDRQQINARVGVLEAADRPNFDDIYGFLQKQSNRHILLSPLLLSGGNHIKEIADGDDSWWGRLSKAGYVVRLSRRFLGEYPSVRKLYLDKINEVFL